MGRCAVESRNRLRISSSGEGRIGGGPSGNKVEGRKDSSVRSSFINSTSPDDDFSRMSNLLYGFSGEIVVSIKNIVKVDYDNKNSNM